MFLADDGQRLAIGREQYRVDVLRVGFAVATRHHGSGDAAYRHRDGGGAAKEDQSPARGIHGRANRPEQESVILCLGHDGR
ncbi:hypothetical protein SDC9_196949 [bioreactor metagenome]|uniref:Uncharacterized protein n=1 Tax=bioreactor metagenome TaxID=1076179 RepID=A0A645IDB8_9ZZZZ